MALNVSQEMDEYEKIFRPTLGEKGYESVYKQRPNKPDGCAIFFKREKYSNLISPLIFRFELRSSHAFHFMDPHQRVGLVLCLGLKEFQKQRVASLFGNICIASTHLFWNKEAVDVQVAEVSTLLDEISNFNTQGYPSIICGGTFLSFFFSYRF
jgi:mRNA deadenylase 3'-5' endonuclease subunit Ccr4